jgi:uncharacterized damage-inducible protein DinB
MGEINMKTEAEFLKLTSDRFKEGFERIDKAISQLNTNQIWTRPSSESNSVGIIFQHLTGNLNQWICAGLGGSGYKRNRNEEFKQNPGIAKEEILKGFQELGEAIADVIARIPQDSLHSPKRIQGMDVTVMLAIMKALTHFEFHEGQILYIAKLLLNERYTILWGPKPA